uniref:Uncharacterized protein n=1 Tax=Rhizophora mucronata TaxID=61149 RepID=A0A2P2N085_RHIMU
MVQIRLMEQVRCLSQKLVDFQVIQMCSKFFLNQRHQIHPDRSIPTSFQLLFLVQLIQLLT